MIVIRVMKADYKHKSDVELFELLTEEKPQAEKAFAELYERHSSRVYAYCRRFLGNSADAEDIFQETFSKFFQSATEHRDMTNVAGFLITIARNLCLNFVKREKSNLEFNEEIFVDIDNRQEQDELLNLIKIGLDLLPDDYRDLFILREYDGMSYKEIAEVTNMTMATVKVKLYRAKKKLRTVLQPYLADLSKFE